MHSPCHSRGQGRYASAVLLAGVVVALSQSQVAPSVLSLDFPSLSRCRSGVHPSTHGLCFLWGKLPQLPAMYHSPSFGVMTNALGFVAGMTVLLGCDVQKHGRVVCASRRLGIGLGVVGTVLACLARQYS